MGHRNYEKNLFSPTLMRSPIAVVLCLMHACLAPVSALVVSTPLTQSAPVARLATPAIVMGPAKDGPFTPAVLFAKVILGEPRLLKLRGKAISIHSQAINEFCVDFGVPKKMNQALIKKAKAVGSELGFLS